MSRTIIGQIHLGADVSCEWVRLALPEDARNFANGLLVRVTWDEEQRAREGVARVVAVNKIGRVKFSKPLSRAIPAVCPVDFLLLDVDEPTSF